MNTLSAHPEKRRQNITLMWAGGGTVLLHSAFLITLYLWPKPPIKPKERLLEVNLTQKDPTAVPKPTPVPTKPPKPTPAPRPTMAPRPTLAPLPTAVPRPTLPPPTPRPRVARVIPPPPTQKPIPTPVPQPTKVVVIPTAVPTEKPQVTPRPKAQAPTKNATSGSPKSVVPTPIPNKNPGSQRPGGSSAPPNPNPGNARPTGGNSGRFFARNPGPVEEPNSRNRPNTASDSAPKGSNNLGNNNETAGAIPGMELPRTSARRGRGKPSDSTPSSAPVRTKDGTELNIGPSSPSSSNSGSRANTTDTGNGDMETGARRTGGLSGATGTRNIGNDRAGRGDDEAAGTGVSGAGSGSGTRGNSRGGRTGSRLAGDPFGTGGGNGGYGKGNGDGGNGGTGSGPSGGTRIARRGTGNGDADGDGGFGRGTGTGTGRDTGPGSGNGGRGTDGNGRGNGRGDEDSIGTATTGIGRSRSTRGNHRTGEKEDEIGRGIWGGFNMTFYQDKSQYPDDIDTRTIQGKPVDWPVFTGTPKRMLSPNLNFDWGEKPPMPGMKSTYWSMRAVGRIFVPKDDNYTFYFDKLDDAGSLSLDGETIIRVWQIQQSTPSSKEVFLKRGAHDIKIEYIQGPATAASITLSWKSNSFRKEPVGRYVPPDEN
ncbi:hypothetical protein EON83_03830 [bacterium]|nr:MAG: hypothetical protein EON83_03830 [bacterium]